MAASCLGRAFRREVVNVRGEGRVIFAGFRKALSVVFGSVDCGRLNLGFDLGRLPDCLVVSFAEKLPCRVAAREILHADIDLSSHDQ